MSKSIKNSSILKPKFSKEKTTSKSSSESTPHDDIESIPKSTTTTQSTQSTPKQKLIKKQSPPSQPQPQPQPQQESHKLPTGNAWSTLGPVLAPETLSVITNDFGFTHLTAVQSATIPAFLSNKDVCVQAVTGSGKTLAFVIPMIEILTTLPRPLQQHHIGCIVLTPTRELANQIHSIIEKFTAAVPLIQDATKFLTPPGLCIGGKNPEMELHQLKTKGVNILVGTPGRLDQVLSTKFLFDTSKLELLILDEADRLLEHGFQTNLNNIMKRIPKQRRTGLFSATLTNQIQELARMGLRNPVNITLKIQYKDQPNNNTNTTTSSTTTPTSTTMNADKESTTFDNQTVEMNDGDNDNDDNNGSDSDDDDYQSYKKAQQESNKIETKHQAIPSTLSNYYQIVQPEHKMLHLISFLLQHQHENIIIFFLTCAEVDYFYRTIASFPPIAQLFHAFNSEMIDTVGLQHLIPTNTTTQNKAILCALHGQMQQSKRSRTLDKFKEHTTMHNAEVAQQKQSLLTVNNNTNNYKRLGSVLLCTDVAARGVDVNHVDWVLQFDAPQQPDVFIHRIGRCARAGQRGQALTWLLDSERSFIDMMIGKHVPFNDYAPIQQQLLQDYNNSFSTTTKNGKTNSNTTPTPLDITMIETCWDNACWNPCNELYFEQPKEEVKDTKEGNDNDDDNDDEDDDAEDTIQIKKQKENDKDKGTTTNNSNKDNKKDKKSQQIVSLNDPYSAQGTPIILPDLPTSLPLKEIIPYNTYKVLVEKKDNRREFKAQSKKQSQIEHIALKKQSQIQQEQQQRQSLLPPYTTVAIQYPKIPSMVNKNIPKTDLKFILLDIVPHFIAHCRYCVGYDRYLFELCQKSYVSHISGYKEHLAKFIFPFDRLKFVHIAVGYGLLFLPQLPDLKKYALIWPQFTRLLPKMITTYHNQQIEESKIVESAKKKAAAAKAIQRRRENDQKKAKEREFNQKQREKKKKTRAKTTFEEVKKEWDDLAEEIRQMKQERKKHSGGK